MIVALSHDQLGDEWFDAIATDPSEIDELRFQINTARAMAGARARRGK